MPQPSERVNHKRVARVMRAAGIAGYVKRRRVRTTIPEQTDQKVPDLLKRDFTAAAPEPALRRRHHLPAARRRDEPVPGHRHRLLLTTPRRVGGRRPHAHQPRRRRPQGRRRDPRARLAGAIFHSDHGSVYTSKDYAQLCADLGVTQSMGAVGTSADNALAESFNAALKREVLQDAACWADELACRRQVFRWLTRYNTKRRHSWCRYQSPIAYETSSTATLPTAA